MARSKKAVAKKPRKPSSGSVDFSRIKMALRLLDRHEKNGKSDPEAKVALKFYRTCKRFFARGGRFKRRYTRKKKA